jgi:ParB-like chromosome segregation protein Spo0J
LIKIHDVKMVDVDLLKPDPANPNEMTDKEISALNESFERWGYLVPVVVDQNGVIADGEHRWTVYKQHHQKQIPAIQFEMTDSERRLLRQTMNKLKGKHERLKDAEELKILYEDNKLGELASLIATSEERLLAKIQELDGDALLADSQDVPRTFELVIECADEQHQEQTYNKLLAEGYRVKVLNL